MTLTNTGASIRARLLHRSKLDCVDFQFLLTRYGIERLLYRLSISPEKQHFLLKGALLFDLWYDVPLRPTRDIDLLGFGLAEFSHLITAFESICAVKAEDGVLFDSHSIKAEEIRKDANYSGARLTLLGALDHAKFKVQVDVGCGDAVTPAPEEGDFPTLIPGMPAPRLLVYPRYTVVAEKLEAIISFGMANSRMKDYFDLWVILRDQELDTALLLSAINATFKRRGTSKPRTLPMGLSEQFAGDPQKLKQWAAFVERNKLKAASLSEVVHELRTTFTPFFVE
jgi:hypothetical protein